MNKQSIVSTPSTTSNSTSSSTSNAINFNDIPIQILEQLRTRLNQLNNSLIKLEDLLKLNLTSNFLNSNSIGLIKIQFDIIISQIFAVSKVIESNKLSLKNLNVFPNTEFDTTKFQNLLITLLRKKNIPEVDIFLNNFLKNDDKEDVLLTDEKISKKYYNLISDLINNFNFSGYLTELEINNGLKLDNFLNDKNETKNETKTEVGLDNNEILKFIYQGLDSNINL